MSSLQRLYEEDLKALPREALIDITLMRLENLAKCGLYVGKLPETPLGQRPGDDDL